MARKNYTAELVMARRAVVKRQEAAQEIRLLLTKQGLRSPSHRPHTTLCTASNAVPRRADRALFSTGAGLPAPQMLKKFRLPAYTFRTVLQQRRISHPNQTQDCRITIVTEALLKTRSIALTTPPLPSDAAVL